MVTRVKPGPSCFFAFVALLPAGPTEPRVPAGSPVPKVSKIAAGHYHSFMLTTNGELYAWGDNRRGQLGLGNFISQPVPTLLTAKNGQPVRFTNVATGLYTTIAVADRMALFEVEVFVPPPCKDMGSAGFQSGTITLQEDKATPAPTRVPTKLGDELGFIPCVVPTMTTAPTSKKAAIALRETKSPTAPVSLADLLSVSLAPVSATSAPEFVYVGPFKGKGAVVNYTADPDFEGFITAAPTDGARRRLRGWDTSATTEPITPLDRSAAGGRVPRPLAYAGDGPVYVSSGTWKIRAPEARIRTSNAQRTLLQAKANSKNQTGVSQTTVDTGNATNSPTESPTPSAINFLYTWGANEYGQLGIASHVAQVTTPQAVSFLNHHTVIDLAVGPYSTGERALLRATPLLQHWDWDWTWHAGIILQERGACQGKATFCLGNNVWVAGRNSQCGQLGVGIDPISMEIGALRRFTRSTPLQVGSTPQQVAKLWSPYRLIAAPNTT